MIAKDHILIPDITPENAYVTYIAIAIIAITKVRIAVSLI